MIGKTVSHYKILEQLGQGGMGVVCKALDLKLNRTVALKFLPPHLTQDQEAIERFINEAQAASALEHSNICTIHEINETEDGQMFICMAYYGGETLEKKVTSGQLPAGSVIDIATQVARGLECAHESGIIHRDIKPSNLIITPRQEVKIIDFGLAKLAGLSKLTKTGSTPGTVAYMSPEQVQGKPVDQRTDIWSLGVVLYEMLTGRLPFHGDNEAAIIYSIVTETLEPVQKYRPELSPEILQILARTLEKKAENRYPSVTDLLIDLRGLKKQSTNEEVIGTPRPATGQKKTSTAPTPAQTRRPARKKIWLSLGVVAVLAIIATILLWLPERRLELNPNMTFRTLPIPFTQIGNPGLSPNGKWVVFPAADGNGNWDIYFMNVSGGEPQRIKATINAYSSVDVSPDGSLVVYDSWDDQLQRPEVRVISSFGRTSKVLVGLGSVPRWRSDGKRIGYTVIKQFSKSGVLEFWSVQPNSIDNRLEFVDSTITVGVPSVSWSWSPDGKSVSWIRTFPTGHNEVIVRELTTGEERQLTFDEDNITDVCWANKNAIIHSSNRGGPLKLWMAPVNGGQSMQITKGSGHDMALKVSADGKKLVSLQQQEIGNVWVGNLKDGAARQITFDKLPMWRPSFFPYGQNLLVWMGGTDLFAVRNHLFVMNRDGNNRQQMTTVDLFFGSAKWSPDGKLIAYSSRTMSEPLDSVKVYLMEASNSGTPKLLGKRFPWVWSDSQNLIVGISSNTWRWFDRSFPWIWMRRNEIIFSSRKTGYFNLWMVPVAGGQVVQITKGSGPDLGIRISADEKKLLYFQSEYIGHLWIANSDGSEARQITFDERLICNPSFSPDGQRLLFSMRDPGLSATFHIYMMNRDGDNRQQLTLAMNTLTHHNGLRTENGLRTVRIQFPSHLTRLTCILFLRQPPPRQEGSARVLA